MLIIQALMVDPIPAPSAQAALGGRTSEPLQQGKGWRFILLKNVAGLNGPEFVLEHHCQQLMLDCYG